MRPMTCPFQLYDHNQSCDYRELPIRYAETRLCSETKHLGDAWPDSVRQFTISEGHIICMPPEQSKRSSGVLDLIDYMLDTLGREKTFGLVLQVDPNNKEKYIDNPEAWSTPKPV